MFGICTMMNLKRCRQLIGEIHKTITPFYDNQTGCMSYKSRPALLIANADSDDYVVLPVSTISRSENINPEYDIKVDPTFYPRTNLRRISYIRTHKQTIINRSQISDIICDIKSEYPDLYILVLDKREKFSSLITVQALQ